MKHTNEKLSVYGELMSTKYEILLNTSDVIQRKGIARIQDATSEEQSAPSSYSAVPIPNANLTNTDEVQQFENMIKNAATEARKTTESQLNAESSTALPNHSERIRILFLEAFADAGREYFEDGVQTEFSKSIMRLIEWFHNEAVDNLESLIKNNRLPPKLVAEAFTWLGHSADPISHEKRRKLLEGNLRSSSPYIRDGAVVGLAYLDDPKAIEPLAKALSTEEVGQIREYIEETIHQLKETQAEQNGRAFSSAENR